LEDLEKSLKVSEKSTLFDKTSDKPKPIPEIETTSVSNGDSTPVVIPKLSESEPQKPEPPVLFSEAYKKPLQPKSNDEKVEFGIETSKLDADEKDLIGYKVPVSQPISVVQESKPIDPFAEAPKLVKKEAEQP
jgi:hypothetical protein